jgi:hypothetical protein
LPYLRIPSAVGGGKTCKTDYYYQRTWRSDHISSDGFYNSQYRNPSTWVVEPKTFTPQTLHAGNYSLPQRLIQQVVDCGSSDCSVAVPLPASAEELPICTQSPGTCPWAVTIGASGSNFLYYQSGFETGGVGDVRVTFQQSTAAAVSVVAVQQRLGPDVTFAPYFAASGHQCFLLDIGEKSRTQVAPSERISGAGPVAWPTRPTLEAEPTAEPTADISLLFLPSARPPLQALCRRRRW